MNRYEEFYEKLTSRNTKCLNKNLKDKVVGIAGCGGLGSNVAQMLIRAGVEKIIIADFDDVSVANLNRQFYFYDDIGTPKVDALEKHLKSINPFAAVIKHTEKVTRDNIFKLYKEADIIVEAFDSTACKAMIIKCFMENKTDKYLISASGMGGIESANLIITEKFSENVFLCGDFINDLAPGVLSSRVTIAAAHQAHMVLRLISGFHEVE